MIRRIGLCLAIAATMLVGALPAVAETPIEDALMSATGKAFADSLFKDSAAGIAGCESARKLIKPGMPAYLNFYIERCLATVAEPGGVMGGARCPHYRKVIAIWKATPPPIDRKDEDAAISRARYLRNAKEEVARYCTTGASPPPKYDPEAMLIQPLAAGGRIQTQEGLSYPLPRGFGVKSFNPDSGLAMLRDPAADLDLRVERKGLNDRFTRGSNYPDKETMPSGAVLAWEYIEFIPGSGSYVLYGRVTLPTAYVVLGISTGSRSGVKSVDKEAGLAAFRAIARGVKVIGPRRCIGNCGPGTVKPL